MIRECMDMHGKTVATCLFIWAAKNDCATLAWRTVATMDKNPGTETTPRCAVPRKHIDRDAPEAYPPAPRRRHGAIDHAPHSSTRLWTRDKSRFGGGLRTWLATGLTG